MPPSPRHCTDQAPTAEDLRSYAQENDILAEENFRLAQRLRLYEQREYGLADMPVTASPDSSSEALCGDTSRLQDSTGGFLYIPGTIAKISNNSQHNYIIVDKGSADGVELQSGIITGQGVIGIIDAVSRHYSYAISFKNSGMTVSARIGKTGPVGSLVWDGVRTNGALLGEIPHHIGFEHGDTVYTSGFSSIFPPDIPLGTTGDSKIVNGATYEIKVTLFEDFRALRHVTIVRNLERSEIDSLISKQ